MSDDGRARPGVRGDARGEGRVRPGDDGVERLPSLNVRGIALRLAALRLGFRESVLRGVAGFLSWAARLLSMGARCSVPGGEGGRLSGRAGRSVEW